MNISVSRELEKLIDSKVKTGLYSSASEVVRAGLRLLKHYDEVQSAKLKELKREIESGLESSSKGAALEWNAGEFAEESEKLIKKQIKKNRGIKLVKGRKR